MDDDAVFANSGKVIDWEDGKKRKVFGCEQLRRHEAGGARTR
jgi:hypothetical protein